MRRTLAAGLVLPLLAALPAWSSEGEVKHRIAIMKSLGGHMAAMGVTLREGVGFEQHLSFHAESIKQLSLICDGIFPEGSGRHGDAVKTRAKPQIWSKPEAFRAALVRFSDAAAALVVSVKAGELATAQSQYRDLASACKACHDDFRWRN